jgi:hypothetical protein
MKSALAVACLMLTPFGNCSARGQGNEEQLKKRFLAEYPQACKAWEELCSKAVGSLSHAYDYATKDGPRHTESVLSFECKLPDMARFETRPNKTGLSKVNVEAMNRRYSFVVTSNGDSKPFSLVSVKESHGSKTSPEGKGLPLGVRQIRALLDIPYAFGRSGAFMLSGPTFVVRSVSPLVRDGKNLLKVEFDRPSPPNYVPRNNTRPPSGGFEGFLVVSPDEKWAVYEFECAEKNGNPRILKTGRVEYEGVLDGFPVPKRAIQQTWRLPGREIRATYTSDFHDFRLADVPDRDFTLAAFGIPEDAATPPSAPPPSNRLGYWFLAFAVASLAAAVLFKVASSRAKRAPVS